MSHKTEPLRKVADAQAAQANSASVQDDAGIARREANALSLELTASEEQLALAESLPFAEFKSLLTRRTALTTNLESVQIWRDLLVARENAERARLEECALVLANENADTLGLYHDAAAAVTELGARLETAAAELAQRYAELRRLRSEFLALAARGINAEGNFALAVFPFSIELKRALANGFIPISALETRLDQIAFKNG